MNSIQATTIGIGLLLALVGVYDVSVAVLLGPEATVSHVIRDWSARWPLIPFGIGLLIGHFFG